MDQQTKLGNTFYALRQHPPLKSALTDQVVVIRYTGKTDTAPKKKSPTKCSRYFTTKTPAPVHIIITSDQPTSDESCSAKQPAKNTKQQWPKNNPRKKVVTNKEHTQKGTTKNPKTTPVKKASGTQNSTKMSKNQFFDQNNCGTG
eukprot:gene19179-6472_t